VFSHRLNYLCIMTTTIKINRLRLRAFHGVMEQERIIGNTFEVTVHIRCNVDLAISSDNIDATINYAEIIETIKKEMSIPSKLLEHVAGRIQKAITNQYPSIIGGSITIAKLTPPIPVEVESVAITIQW